ncbi:bifunctional 4-hydroxy-2-oxoglutarate aldolase/2-dehydro-3-deoxy-phosphogluconate aldolase [Leucobacter chinensis]|uniref:bifunctional 4-hydroxy-2-oxoglutarate aldolase/2-dehydro-3-deoxy-phosphogluconate aldolase n=1 Tax=Leucobacter chinensis TaxID=2851010 RepID=UPI001C226262|nr:bifunctional 4-hydroxy-2-oxoglutarate aldolase/2-dehydro-3-deoxy-phosphogluconate aldolase [Leucobacter chinensis]
MTARHRTLQQISGHGIIAVVRASTSQRALFASRVLIESGIRAIEVTYTVPDASGVISELRDEYGAEAVIGAGTLTSVANVDNAISAGAQFLVSPGHSTAVTAAAVESEVLTMIGAFTASEVMAVLDAGADIVKFFPGGLAGPAGIRALAGPFPDAKIVPTGGVSPANLGDWFSAGAVAVGAGSDLAPSAAVEQGDAAVLQARATSFTEALARARGQA